jgi:hypothetical protein
VILHHKLDSFDSFDFLFSDGGRTLHASDPELNSKMALAAQILNIKGHQVWSLNRKQHVLLHSPADLEGKFPDSKV